MEIARSRSSKIIYDKRKRGEAGHKIRFVSEVWIGTHGHGDVWNWPVKSINHFTCFEEHPTLQECPLQPWILECSEGQGTLAWGIQKVTRERLKWLLSQFRVIS